MTVRYVPGLPSAQRRDLRSCGTATHAIAGRADPPLAHGHLRTREGRSRACSARRRAAVLDRLARACSEGARRAHVHCDSRVSEGLALRDVLRHHPCSRQVTAPSSPPLPAENHRPTQKARAVAPPRDVFGETALDPPLQTTSISEGRVSFARAPACHPRPGRPLDRLACVCPRFRRAAGVRVWGQTSRESLVGAPSGRGAPLRQVCVVQAAGVGPIGTQVSREGGCVPTRGCVRFRRLDFEANLTWASLCCVVCLVRGRLRGAMVTKGRAGSVCG